MSQRTAWLAVVSALAGACGSKEPVADAADAALDAASADAAPGQDASDAAQPDTGSPSDCTGHCGYRAIVAFGNGGCALREDESLWCWGNGQDGPLRQELRASALADVSGANFGGAYVVDGGGGLWCLDGARFVPVGGARDFQQVSAANGQACGLRRTGRVSCWPTDPTGFPLASPGEALVEGSEELVAVAVAATAERACLIDDSGALHCWGQEGEGGELGGLGSQALPLRLDGEHAYTRIALSQRETCAIRTDGALACWGAAHGTVVSPGATEPSVPRVLAEGRAFRELALSSQHACALAEEGSVWCWGEGSLGALGSGQLESSEEPVRVGDATHWVDVAVAGTHSCALNDADEVWCWGNNVRGALGSITLGLLFRPRRLAEELQFQDLSLAGDGGCAISVAGELWCWGRADGTALPASTLTDPTRIGSASDWTRVWLSPDFGCGLRGAGEAWCWGLNTHGALGPDTLQEEVPEPSAVEASRRFVSLALGQDAMCGLDEEGALFCWGNNADWVFAEQTPASSATALAVASELAFVDMRIAGGFGNFAVTRDDGLWVWGVDIVQQPPRLSLGDGFTSLAPSTAPTYHQCGLRPDGTLACWGNNRFGSLGLGDSEGREQPTDVPFAGSFSSAALGGGATCALTEAGRLWCWGSLQTIADAQDFVREPRAVLPDRQFERISLGSYGACALDLDGGLHCWGDNTSGTLGEVQSVFPAPVRVALP